MNNHILSPVFARRFVETEIIRREDAFDEYFMQFHGLVGDRKHVAFVATEKDLKLMKKAIETVLG